MRRQDPPLIADCVLEYSDGLPIAVIEVKRSQRSPSDGLAQAKLYAELLDVPFAYFANGDRITELDARTGGMREVGKYPSPAELWSRYKAERAIEDGDAERLITAPLNTDLPGSDGAPARPRYFQQVAINRAVQAIARGDKRLGGPGRLPGRGKIPELRRAPLADLRAHG